MYFCIPLAQTRSISLYKLLRHPGRVEVSLKIQVLRVYEFIT